MIKEIILLYLSIASVIGIEYFNGNVPPPGLEQIPIAEKQFRVVYEWRTIDFAYDNEYERGRARQNGEFIERNILISDVKAFANRLYVTLPRMLPGVPATLGWIISPDNNGRSDPMVEPFPSWDMNKEGNCWALQFVQGIAISADGVLWAVDSGRIHTLRPDRAVATCPPKIVLIDLKGNGTVLHRYEFPEDVVSRGKNYLNKIVVDDALGGYAYITDNSGSDPGIVVFSRRFNRSWKVREPNSMRAAANAVDFAVNGTSLRFSIHIDGIALGPYYNPNTGNALEINAPKLTVDDYERNVYYSPLSSYHLYSLPASLLRDPEVVLRSSPRQLLDAVTDYGLKLSQSDGMIMDNRGILYYGLLKEHAIAQWDSFQPFTAVNQHVIAKDDDFIQWTDGMTFDERGNLFVVVNRLHNFVAGRLNPNEINFRILRARTGGLSYVFTNSPGYTPINLTPEQGLTLNTNNLNFGPVSSTPFYNQLESRNPYFGYSSSSRPYISSIVFLCIAVRSYFYLFL